MPLPALHAANVDRMRQRFEEAKQRMNLMHQRALDSGLIARGGGGGGGGGGAAGSNPAFTNLRSSFEDSRDQVSVDALQRTMGNPFSNISEVAHDL